MLKKLLLGEGFSCYPSVRPHVTLDKDGEFAIPLPCSGRPQNLLRVQDIEAGKAVQLEVEGKKIHVELKGKSWRQIMKELQRHGAKMTCNKSKCFLAQDASTPYLYKAEEALLYLASDTVFDLRRTARQIKDRAKNAVRGRRE